MDPIGIVILVVAVLAIVAGIIFALFGKSYYPPFKFKKEGFYRDHTAIVWAESEALLAKYNAINVAKAAWACELAWNQTNLPNDKLKDTLKKVGVIIVSKPTFPKWGYFSADLVSSVQLFMRDKVFDPQIPVVVVHEGVLDRLFAQTGDYMMKGQPVIHELFHAVIHRCLKIGADSDHKRDDIWQKIDEKVQVEELAEEFYTKEGSK